MNIGKIIGKTKLKDPKYCDGCQYLINGQCVYYLIYPGTQYEGNASKFRLKGYIRLQRCIIENGE